MEREEWEARMRQRVVQDQETHVEKERVRLARHRDAEIEKTIHTLQSECSSWRCRYINLERKGRRVV